MRSLLKMLLRFCALRCFLRCFLCCALCCAGHAGAIPVLTLDRLGPGLVRPGDTTSYELRLTGSAAVLGAFGVDLSFNRSALDFVSVQFGPLLGDPLSEAVGDIASSGFGMLHLDEVSLLDDASLFTLQHAGGGVLFERVLATVTFRGATGGAGGLKFVAGSPVLADAGGARLDAPLVGTPDAVFVVPLPNTLALLVAGLLALACRRTPRERGWA